MIKKLLIIIFILSLGVSSKAQLTGMNPNVANLGQTLNTTITGSGIFIQSSSPSGNIYDMYLQQGATTIYFFDWNNQWNYFVNVLSTDSVSVQGTLIPGNSPTGSYDLHVTTGDVLYPWMNQNFYTLPAAFTIAPPDGNVTGTVYFDTNNNGIKDGGETGASNQQLLINPGNIVVTTDANGGYTLGLYNGNYTVQWVAAANNNYTTSSPSPLSFTINNADSSGNNFGLINAITSIAINYGEIGTTVGPTITANGIFTTIPSQVYLRKTVSPFNTIFSSGNSIIDPDHLGTVFTIANTASLIGGYDLFVTVGGVNYEFANSFAVILFSSGITGKVFFDTNGNGIFDAGELPSSNSQVELIPGNILSYSDNSGDYGFGAANGNYTVQYLPKYYETVTSASSYNVTVNNNIVGGNDFGVQITPGFDSLSLYVDHWLLRCNWNHIIFIQSTNSGFGPVNGKIFFLKDATMSYFSSTPPANYVSGDTAYWNFTNLLPGQTFYVSPVYSTPAAGTNVNFHVIAAITDAGNNITFTNQRDLNVTVSCSYDPNDKRVNPPGVQIPNYTLFDKDLYYTIRFQNTGNDTAFKVVILDTLDSDLDFSTFEFISSSHPVRTELDPANGALKFTFNNILLPDSNVNEPASSGELTYRIKSLTGLPANTEINNTAHIIFDLNTPVVTNTTLNTMVYIIPTGIDEIYSQDGLSIYPNPMDESTTIYFKNPNQVTYTLSITDIEGRITEQRNTNSNQINIYKHKLNSGLYFFRLSNENRTINYFGKFVIR